MPQGSSRLNCSWCPRCLSGKEAGDKGDGRPTGPSCLLGSLPMASGKPGDPKSALLRSSPGSSGLMVPPLLSLPTSPPGLRPSVGRLRPRFDPYGCRCGVWAEPAFPGPEQGSPHRGGFHKNRHPQRLKSWLLVRKTCHPEDEA